MEYQPNPLHRILDRTGSYTGESLQLVAMTDRSPSRQISIEVCKIIEQLYGKFVYQAAGKFVSWSVRRGLAELDPIEGVLKASNHCYRGLQVVADTHTFGGGDFEQKIPHIPDFSSFI